ncbi:MAG: TIP41-like protein [Olpidium bornovanus]|uniref:TIP41-like protein n=1 Tax=Olpidium bornovanus TaxID=278681 RepID=A0A8H7ZS21_9FUNG|nr:MAG: TIP41-like protein [Olpidium bornovanus]
MIFGKNYVCLEHERGFKLMFNTADALTTVDNTRRSGEAIKVSYSEEWSKRSTPFQHKCKPRPLFTLRRSNTSLNHQEDIKDIVKPYDWTYSVDYAGTLVKPAAPGGTFEPTDESIDVETLKRPDPIMVTLRRTS